MFFEKTRFYTRITQGLTAAILSSTVASAAGEHPSSTARGGSTLVTLSEDWEAHHQRVLQFHADDSVALADELADDLRDKYGPEWGTSYADTLSEEQLEFLAKRGIFFSLAKWTVKKVVGGALSAVGGKAFDAGLGLLMGNDDTGERSHQEVMRQLGSISSDLSQISRELKEHSRALASIQDSVLVLMSAGDRNHFESMDADLDPARATITVLSDRLGEYMRIASLGTDIDASQLDKLALDIQEDIPKALKLFELKFDSSSRSRSLMQLWIEAAYDRPGAGLNADYWQRVGTYQETQLGFMGTGLTLLSQLAHAFPADGGATAAFNLGKEYFEAAAAGTARDVGRPIEHVLQEPNGVVVVSARHMGADQPLEYRTKVVKRLTSSGVEHDHVEELIIRSGNVPLSFIYQEKTKYVFEDTYFQGYSYQVGETAHRAPINVGDWPNYGEPLKGAHLNRLKLDTLWWEMPAPEVNAAGLAIYPTEAFRDDEIFSIPGLSVDATVPGVVSYQWTDEKVKDRYTHMQVVDLDSGSVLGSWEFPLPERGVVNALAQAGRPTSRLMLEVYDQAFAQNELSLRAQTAVEVMAP